MYRCELASCCEQSKIARPNFQLLTESTNERLCYEAPASLAIQVKAADKIEQLPKRALKPIVRSMEVLMDQMLFLLAMLEV